MSEQTVDHAVREAHRAFETWRGVSVGERAALVGRAARLMRERSEHLARLVTLEMGKLIRHSRVEMDLSARILQYYADKAPRAARRRAVGSRGRLGHRHQ
nr:aldehyde dehydrogenase family protein [Pseudofrankia asymbiotica]